MFTFAGDFDEIKQDISSFRYEMLNHLNVRRDDNTVAKDKMDRLYGKIDSVIVQQKELARGLSISDDSNTTTKFFFSTNSESIRSSTDTESLNTYKGDDEDNIASNGTPRLKKLSSVIRKVKPGCEEMKKDAEHTEQCPNALPSKREEMLKRQEVIGCSLEEDSAEDAIQMNDIQLLS